MFKDIIADDINSVFMNTDEFADKAKIDGKTIVIVLDNEKLKENNEKQELNGLVGDIFYFTNKAEWKAAFGKLPKANDAQMFNVTPCTVVDVGDTNGVLSITLAYRS